MDETIAGRSVQGKQAIARRLARANDALNCNILFISSSEQNHLAEILKSAEGKNMLTVAETGSFLSQGGMINFDVEQSKVRFEINVAAVERANLKISPQLLKVAKLAKQ